MNGSHSLEYFAATLQANQSIRHQAELKLRELAETPGFLGACLDLISSTEPVVTTSIKKAAAVYFKNRMVRYWSIKDSKIDPDERPVIKDRILPAIISCDYAIKQQLIPVLRVMISVDFSSWDGLLDKTGQLLQQVPSFEHSTSDMPGDDLHLYSQLYTGLLCFSEISRKFRWVNNVDRKYELYPIIESAFPHLLTIGSRIVHNSHNITELTAEILKLILKCYKFVTYFDFPEPLQTREATISWLELHGAITNMAPPAYVMNPHYTEVEKSIFQVSKCYKWSVANIYRIFSRYASRNLSKKLKYKDFSAMFSGEFIPHLLTNYLSIIEQWCSGSRWLSLPAIYYLIEFLSHCVTQKSTSSLIRPYFENLVGHLIFPLLCPTDQALETFEEDPHEYINLYCDNINDDTKSPDLAALGLLVTFIDKDSKSGKALELVLTFINNQLTELKNTPSNDDEALDISKKKEAVLRMLGSISSYILNSQSYQSQMESFLTNLIIPDLSSSHEFLKARTLDIISRYADIEFHSEDNLLRLFQGILQNFDASANPNLVVRFEAALAIQAYLPNEKFKLILGNIILPTMSMLLELSNETDNDSVSVVMQECVENFSEQLQPFGIDLMTKLVSQFMKLASEVNEASNVDVDDFDANDDGFDKSSEIMAAIGLLNTMISILLSFENSKEICLKLEETISPMIQYVLENQLDDFLTEICELIENSSFLLRSISPVMWKNFEYLYQSFENGIALMYMEELNGCLQNFMIFGAEDLAKSPELMDKFFNIFKLIIEQEEDDDEDVANAHYTSYNDSLFAYEICQTFILSLQNSAANYIPYIVTKVLRFKAGIEKESEFGHVRSCSVDINTNNVIIASMIYANTVTLNLLQETGQFKPFFESWFNTIPRLKRVYDLKLSLLGIISLLTNDDLLRLLNDVGIVDQFGKKACWIIKEMPVAIGNLEKKRKNFDDLEDEMKFTGDNNWENHWETASDDLEEILVQGEEAAAREHQLEVSSGREEYLDFLQQEEFKSTGYFSDNDKHIVEDPLATTPLDTVDIFAIFRDFVKGVGSDGSKYDAIFGNLDEHERFELTKLFN